MAGRFLLATTAILGAAVGYPGDSHTAVGSNSAHQTAAIAADSKDPSARCAGLAGRKLGDASIDKAEFVPAGSALAPSPVKNSPEFCRVSASISLVEGSNIKIQVWLPTQWNGKFFGYGGGGFEGSYGIANIVLRRPVSAGYAAVVTDAGHDVGGEPKWALGQPEKIVDFGNRANHMGAIVAKAVVADFYGAPAKRSYFHGCSNGGRDALMLAQRHPGDYDAIAVGAPAYDFTARLAGFSQTGLDFSTPAGKTLVTKLKLLNDAVLAKCDATDGVKDGVIERPNMCRFNPVQLQCKSGTASACLSKAEVGLVKSMYRGTVDRKGRLINAGFPPGSELGWAPQPLDENMGTALLRYMVYDDPTWSPTTFVLDRDYAAARKKLGQALDAKDPDLRPFLRRGGKLLMYHGWNDTAIPAGNTLRYHDAAVRTVGRGHAEDIRLFMLPGVEHCGQGKGPDQVDFLAALDRWSEGGAAPQILVAAKHDNRIAYFSQLPTKIVRSRPICAWPKAARYKGTGSTDDAASFECR